MDKLQEALNQAAAESLRADEAEKEAKGHRERADKAEGELRAMTTKYDALVAERADVDVEKLQKQLSATQTLLQREKQRADAAEDPENIRKLVQARVSLEAQARGVLGDEIRLDDMSDREVMESVIERLDSPVADGASDAYVQGCFSTLVKGHTEGSAALDRIQEIVNSRQDDDKKTRTDNRSAREKFLERQENAWKEAQ